MESSTQETTMENTLDEVMESLGYDTKISKNEETQTKNKDGIHPVIGFPIVGYVLVIVLILFAINHLNLPKKTKDIISIISILIAILIAIILCNIR